MTNQKAPIQDALCLAQAGQVIPIHKAVASAWPVQCAENIQEGTFARARGTDQRHHLSRRNLQVKSLERHDFEVSDLFVLPAVPHNICATLCCVVEIKVHGPFGHDGSVYRLHRY